jgi:hypothetical protein
MGRIEGAPLPLYDFMTEAAGGTLYLGTGNYSGGNTTDFAYQTGTGEISVIHRLIISIGDSTAIRTDGYGGRAGLTGGITVKVEKEDGTTVVDLNDGNLIPIKTTADWAKLCYDLSIFDTGAGLNSDYALIRWTFSRAGMPIILDDRDKLVITLNDDFVDLTDHTFKIQGYKFSQNNKAEVNRLMNKRYN